jgi:hypothetical protein
MTVNDIKTTIIAILICILTIPLISLFHTILDFSTKIQLNAPLSSYILLGFSPQIVGGFYIATQKIKKKVWVCLIVGFTYSIARELLSHFFFFKYIEGKQFNLYGLTNYSILSMILIVGAYSLFSQLFKKKSV